MKAWHDLNLNYASSSGDIDLREQIADQYPGLSVDDIATFAGAQEAIFVVYHALLSPGDLIQAISPHFGPLHLVAEGLGAKIDIQPMDFSSVDSNTGVWSLNIDQWCNQQNASAVLSVINFPHNPTGAMVTQQELERMVASCEEKDCWLFSDEVFRGLEYSEQDRLSPVASLYDKGISLGVMSKAYGLGGVRVGWIACRNRALHKRILEIKEYLSICNGRTDELLARIALRNGAWILDKNRQLSQQNLKILEDNRSVLSHLRWSSPKAGFLMYPQVVGVDSSGTFVQEMLEKSETLVFPGHCFGTGANHFRIGYGRKEFNWQALIASSS